MILANNIRHFINGNDFGEPRDWQGLEIFVDWRNETESAKLNITDLEFVLKANKYLQERILNGLNGGVGIFEGEPYQIKIGDPESPSYVFDGYLDFTDDTTFVGNESVVCSLKKKKGTDWLNDVADGFSFAYLYDQNTITDGDFVRVPYVINYIPDGLEIAVLSISIYMMTKEIIENVQALAETIADVTDASTPVIGVSVGLGAGVVTAWDIGNFILTVLKTLARIAYIIAITLAIIQMVESLFQQILPPKRHHLGMTFRKLLERGCQHLGLNLQSSIAELDWVFIPRKDKKGGENGETGFPTNSGGFYTFGDAIRTLKDMFNANHKIIDNTFIFERKDFFEFNGTYQIPEVLQDQTKLLNNVKFNTDEMVANYNISFQYDIQDQNTLNDQNGRVFQAITRPINTNNENFVNIKGLAEIIIPFSLGKTKTQLNNVETIAKSLGQIVDTITGIFGGGTSFESQIESRSGSLLLSSDFVSIPKVVAMNGTNLQNNQREIINAKHIWEQYHYINSFAEVNGHHNQWWRYPATKVPMTLKEFESLIDNNSGVYNGMNFVIESLKYYPEGRYGILEYRVQKKYTNNLKIDYV